MFHIVIQVRVLLELLWTLYWFGGHGSQYAKYRIGHSIYQMTNQHFQRFNINNHQSVIVNVIKVTQKAQLLMTRTKASSAAAVQPRQQRMASGHTAPAPRIVHRRSTNAL